MDQEQKDKNLYKAFLAGIVFKGLVALAEMVLGLVLVFYEKINSFIFLVAQKQLQINPDAVLANYVQKYQNLLPTQISWFIIIYVFSRGFIKVFLIVGLLKKKLWTYPTSIAVIGLFMVYQIYELFRNHSIWLVILTVIDVVIVWLIWKEYLRLKTLWKVEK